MSDLSPQRSAAKPEPTEEASQRPEGAPPETPEGQAPEADNAQRDDERAPSVFDIELPEYAGPLDLLLDLIRKQKINVYDIPIHKITAQYLEYLKRAEQLNVDLGGEFVFMASTLIHIKSKMLLPKDPTVPEEEQEDPREELVRQLVEHEKFVQAAQMLREKRVIEENVWSNPPVGAFDDEEDDEPGLTATVFDLVKTFQTVLERFKNRPTYEVSDEEVSVASRIEFLKNMMLSEDRPLSLEEVFERQAGVRALVATFLALLELVRMQAIQLRQSETFGSIVLRKHKMFDTVFNEDGPLTAADAEYSE